QNGTGTNGTAVSLSKFGTGKLTLAGTNTFTGSLVVNNGTVALAATGSVGSISTLSVLNNSTFDASLSSFTPTNAATVNGRGVIKGNATLVSASTITPATVGTVGTLTFANNLSITATNINADLALASTIGSGTNDLVDVTGQLTLVGTGTIT